MQTAIDRVLAEYGFTEDVDPVSTIVVGGPVLAARKAGVTAAARVYERNPATGRDGKESPSDGGKFRTKKGGTSESKAKDDDGKKDAKKVSPFAELRDAQADKILADAVDTQEMYAGPVEGYTQERVDTFQDPWIASELVKGTPGQTNPVTLFMAGGSGSGKSTLLPMLSDDLKPPDSVMVNPDLAKEANPEFKKLVSDGSTYAAAGTHEESSDMSKRLLGQAVAGDYHAIVDGTGNSGTGKFMAKIDAQKALGRKVKIVMADIPTDVAVERARKRAERTGRFVPEKEIRAIHKSVAVNHKVWRDQVDDWEVWANDGAPGTGKVIARRVGGGKIEVLYKARYQQALDKADE